MSTETTIREAALQLNVSEQRIRTLCREGQLSARKIGTHWLISQPSLEQYGLISGHKVAENHPAYNVSKINQHQPIALSFFSGAMGLDLGIEKAGFYVRLACEVDRY